MAAPLEGSWAKVQVFAGSSLTMNLQTNGSAVSGAGTFAGEAGPSGTVAVVGTRTGNAVQLDFTLTTTLPPIVGTRTEHFAGTLVGATLQGTMQYDTPSAENLSAPALFARADALAGVSGIIGTVRRGPITPVCRLNVACDAPFSAGFSVRRGNSQVATFRSDAAGNFLLLIGPGTYTIVPAADAPIINPSAQVKTVIVSGGGLLTLADLEFDTGIR